MWKRPANWQLLLTTVLLAPAAASVAADDEASMVSTNKNRFTLGPRLGFHINASFTGLGRFPAPTAIGPVAGGQNHEYDDGFVRIDSGVPDGQTWNWGYSDAGQVNGANSTIAMHSSSASGDASSKDVNCDPQYGAEIVYTRELGRMGRGRWGIEAALGYNAINLEDKKTLAASVQRVTDAYSYTPGTTPPAAPFAGDFNGPNFVINDTPNRSTALVADGALVSGQREFEASLLGLRIGPFLEMPLAKDLTLSVSGGLAIMGVHSDFRWRESVTVAGAGAYSSHGSGTRSAVQLGGYLSATLNYSINENWSVYGGVQFQSVGDYTHSVGGRKANLDLSSTVYVSVGVGYSF